MTEKELAENICRVHAQDIVDAEGGVTLGGITLGEKYAERLYRAGGYDPVEVSKYEMALRHWVDAAGYGKDGKFVCVMATSIRNC
jgi:hypothetical protein